MARLQWPEAREHLGRVDWPFVVPLLAGILSAVFLLAAFLERQLEENPVILAAGFFGLVVGSVVVAWRLLRRPKPLDFVVGAVVGVVLFVLLGASGAGTVGDPSLLGFFAAGALAICAMILPGISGSLILVLIGMYPAVLGAVNDRDFAAVGIFVLGAVIGLALFSQVLHWALANYHDVVLAGLIGLMAGSLRILWPWPDGVEGGALAAPGSDWPAALIAGLIGLGVVLLISRLSERLPTSN
jgi:putative membrane protein